MVLGKLPGPGRPTIWMTVGQGLTALAVGAGGVVWTFLLSSIFSSPISPSLRETARYRFKYFLKGPLNPKQPTNQIRAHDYSFTLFTEESFQVDRASCVVNLAAPVKVNNQIQERCVENHCR